MKKVGLWIFVLPILAFAAEPSLLEKDTLYVKEICESIDHKLGKDKETLRANFGASINSSRGPIECGGGGGFEYKYWHSHGISNPDTQRNHLDWQIGEKGYICTAIYDENYDLVSYSVEYISEEKFLKKCRPKYEGRPGMENMCERPEL
jgi:hypothetical protein